MSRSDLEYLQHILDEIGYLAGEVSPSTRTLASEVDWRAIAGMRDHLVHGYFGVDYEIVWDVVVRKMPELRPSIAKLLQQSR